MRSIRRRLLLLQLSAVLLVSGLAVAGAYYRIRDEFYEMQDYHLQQVALLLMQQGELADMRGLAPLPEEEDLDFIGQIWSENHKLIYSSHEDYPLPLPDRAGLSTVEWDDELFRVYALTRHGRTVQVAQSLEVREAALQGMSLRLMLPLVLIVPLLGIATWITVGRGLRPLGALREEVTQRNPASLLPIALEHAPDEVKPLVGSLNDLLLRLGQALDSQRRFTADAAHELRTPLTGVKLQFQLLERAQSPQERHEAIALLKAGIEQAIRLVHQLLTLARLEPDSVAVAHLPVALGAMARRAVADFTPMAAERSIALQPEAVRRGHPGRRRGSAAHPDQQPGRQRRPLYARGRRGGGPRDRRRRRGQTGSRRLGAGDPAPGAAAGVRPVLSGSGQQPLPAAAWGCRSRNG